MKNSYIYYLEQMRVRVMKACRCLPLIFLKYVSLSFVIYLYSYLFIFFLLGEIVSGQLIKTLYSEDPLKSVLPFFIFATAISFWGALVMKAWRCLPIIWKKYVSLFLFIGLSLYLSISFLEDGIVSGHLKYESYLELIKMLYSENPLKSALPFSIFAMVMSLWSVLWRVWDKNIEFKNAEFSQNELRFSNAVNLLSKTDGPIFMSEGIRELARLKMRK